MRTEKPFALPVAERRIYGCLQLPHKAPTTCIVTCHGLFSNKNSEKFVAIADAFCSAGMAVIRFDFSGCGESSGRIAETTVTRRLQELNTVVDWVRTRMLPGARIGLLGSSLGGFVALLYAARNEVPVVSCWATPYDLTDLDPRLPAADRARLNPAFFRDAAAWQLEGQIGTIHALQVIHGTDDQLVPCGHAQQLYQAVSPPRDLLLIQGGDHRLSDPAWRQTATERSRSWFLEQLQG